MLSCFDRMLFRGYLPIMSGWQMAQFFNSSGIRFRELKPFLVQNAERVKRHAIHIAEQEGRPYVYLHEKIKKEDLAKQIAERDPIEEGRICILSVLEPCRTFSFRTEKGKPFVASARRQRLGFFADCAAKKWPFGQSPSSAVCEKARSAFSRQPSA